VAAFVGFAKKPSVVMFEREALNWSLTPLEIGAPVDPNLKIPGL
jgi:hypothetical protein